MAIYAGRPNSGSATSVMERPANFASEKQIAFALKLLGEKNTDGVRDIPRTEAELGTMSKRSISSLIDFLMSQPRKADVAPEVGPGVYKLDNELYKVNKSRSSGYHYAMLWTGAGWDFEGGKGVYHKLTPAHALSAEDAKAFGDEHHFCVYCATELTDQRSIDAGYGPICAGKYGLPWG